MGTGATERTWRARLKKAWRALVGQAGTHDEVAQTLGVSRQLVGTWADEAEQKVVGWEHAINPALPARARAAFFDVVAGPGVAVVAVEEWMAASARAADLALSATALRAALEAPTLLVEAVKDGRITAAEATRIREAVDVAIGLLLAIRERADLAIRERVIGENTDEGPRRAA